MLYASGDANGAKRAVAHALELLKEKKHIYADAWLNSLNVAVYYLAAGNEDEGRTLIEHAIKARAPKFLLSGCLRDLIELNNVMPSLAGVCELINLLEKQQHGLSEGRSG